MVVKTPGTAGQRRTTEGSTDRSTQPVCAELDIRVRLRSNQALANFAAPVLQPVVWEESLRGTRCLAQ